MKQSQKLQALEGLRGIASFVVLVWHLRLALFVSSSADILSFFSAFLPNAVARLLTSAVQGFYGGSFAVWLFWIMSAFVLALPYFQRAYGNPVAHARSYLKDASLRRYPRLLVPVLASVAFAYAIHAMGMMHNLEMIRTEGAPCTPGWLGSFYKFPPDALDAVKSALWESFFAYRSSTTYNANLWTMEKEFYGSLFLFAFLALMGHRRARFYAYPVIGILNLVLHMYWMDAFVVGILLCDLYVNRGLQASSPDFATRWPKVHFACTRRWMVALLWFLILAGAGYENRKGLLFLLLGMVAVGLALLSAPVQRILTNRVAVFLGKISFGLYLVHIPLICSFSCWAYLTMQPLWGIRAAAWLAAIATCVLAILCGYLLYLLADQPGIRLSRRWSSFLTNAFDKASSRRVARAT